MASRTRAPRRLNPASYPLLLDEMLAGSIAEQLCARGMT